MGQMRDKWDKMRQLGQNGTTWDKKGQHGTNWDK